MNCPTNGIADRTNGSARASDLAKRLIQEYPLVKIFGANQIYCSRVLLFGAGEIVGPCDELGYVTQWMYEDYKDALVALELWDGIGEPSGWVRRKP